MNGASMTGRRLATTRLRRCGTRPAKGTADSLRRCLAWPSFSSSQEHRAVFNQDVATYNTRIRQFPEIVPAFLMRLKPREMFRVSAADGESQLK
jgi:LemA family